MTTRPAFDLGKHIETRTPTQAFIDGAFADARRDEADYWAEWADFDPDDEGEYAPGRPAGAYVAWSLSVQRKIREAVMQEGMLAGIDGGALAVMLTAIFGPEDGATP